MYHRCGENREKCVFLPSFFPPPTARGGAICFSACKLSTRLLQTKPCDNRRSISTAQPTADPQPARCPARPTNIDGGLENTGWVHGLGGESLPAASYGILPNLKKKYIFCHSRRMEKVVFCFVHTSGQLSFHHRLVSSRHMTPAMV